MRIPMVVTDVGTYPACCLKGLPTTFGTPELVDRARSTGRRRVELLLPPVDVDLNAPGAVDPAPFRNRYGSQEGEITVVTVSRLMEAMKGEGLLRTINVVRALGHDLPLRFILAGDGAARAKLEVVATDVNAELGRAAVIFTGSLLAPRPAYAGRKRVECGLNWNVEKRSYFKRMKGRLIKT
jgi:glycosyltransferase involved in cell wall biosynthesis